VLAWDAFFGLVLGMVFIGSIHRASVFPVDDARGVRSLPAVESLYVWPLDLLTVTTRNLSFYDNYQMTEHLSLFMLDQSKLILDTPKIVSLAEEVRPLCTKPVAPSSPLK
jgi:hypothetical protein